ncbi:hypothetical protein FRC17_003767 [Serendipita sp. 399]|nr:hypothetical protein FRC17_003767 [Serendipita sp. 399]
MSLNLCTEPLAKYLHPQVLATLTPLVARQDLSIADPPLSEEEYLWLESRPDRYAIWNDFVKDDKMVNRPYVCEKHELGWSYLSTGFSFADD